MEKTTKDNNGNILKTIQTTHNSVESTIYANICRIQDYAMILQREKSKDYLPQGNGSMQRARLKTYIIRFHKLLAPHM